MKKIFTLFAALAMVMSMSAETYRYSGEKDNWKGSTMTVSSDGYYSYYGPVTGAHQFKIGTSTNQWAYNHSYVSKGFNSTDITDLGDYGGDNAYCWSSKKHYILVYHPSTKINSSSKVKICASTFLPDDSETDLPEPEPEPTELAYNVTVPAGTKACYICGNMTAWKFTEMTKVNDTQYTITIEGAKKDDEYKYASGSAWDYVEKDNNGNEIGNRTYVDGNDVVAKWASVFDPDAVEQELTYNVTVPAGTYACYIAMDSDPAKNGWEFTAMTKVDDTHYTFKHVGLKNKPYKYSSGPAWDYEEQTADGGQVADRHWAEKDEVAKWKAVYDPTPIYTVKVTAENGTVEGLAADGKYKHGEQATFTATPAEGYEFVNWTVAGEEVATTAEYTFTVTADVALVANFKKSVVTITKSFDLTPENVGNRPGRQTISVEDVDLGSVQLVIKGFSTEVTEYAEASLAIGDDVPLTATATYTNDAENNKEIYTAIATSADGSTIYNFTFNISLPTSQEFNVMAYENITATKLVAEWGIEYSWEGATEDWNIYIEADNMGNAFGSFNDTDVMALEFEVEESMGMLSIFGVFTDGTNTYQVYVMGALAPTEEPVVEPTDTITLTSDDLVVTNYSAALGFKGSINEKSGYTIEFTISDATTYGKYGWDGEWPLIVNVALSSDEESIWLDLQKETEVVYYKDETTGQDVVEGQFIDSKTNVLYVVTMKTVKPETPSDLENIAIDGKTVKSIINGQLIIVKDGVQYNAQGAILK